MVYKRGFGELWIWLFEWPSLDARITKSTNPQSTDQCAGVGARHTDYKWGNDALTKRMVALPRLDYDPIFWLLDFLLLRLV